MVGAAGFLNKNQFFYFEKKIELEMKLFLVLQNLKYLKLNLDQHKQQILELIISNIYFQ
jgi:hypothetical protein